MWKLILRVFKSLEPYFIITMIKTLEFLYIKKCGEVQKGVVELNRACEALAKVIKFLNAYLNFELKYKYVLKIKPCELKNKNDKKESK